MTKPTFLKAFRVSTTINEFGALGRTVGYTRDKKSATLLAKDRGWWGGPGSINEVTLIKVGSRLFELADKKPVKLDENLIEKNEAEQRRTALLKLNPAERKLLGIKPQD